MLSWGTNLSNHSCAQGMLWQGHPLQRKAINNNTIHRDTADTPFYLLCSSWTGWTSLTQWSATGPVETHCTAPGWRQYVDTAETHVHYNNYEQLAISVKHTHCWLLADLSVWSQSTHPQVFALSPRVIVDWEVISKEPLILPSLQQLLKHTFVWAAIRVCNQ